MQNGLINENRKNTIRRKKMIDKKYKLGESKEFDGRTLYRVIALKDFYAVKVGDIGGWIETEANLSQDGNSWIEDEAKVFDNAQVSGDAYIYDNARIFGNAHVFGNTQVFDSAQIYGNALVSGDSVIYDNTLICGTAKVYSNGFISGYACVCDGAIVTKPVNIISTADYDITISDNYMKIGRENYPIADWESFTDEQISKMTYCALDWWKVWKPILMAIIKAS
jgi:carbonic anhydrase/acetyltransferase-like protein (isoleucine patch superfamily)